jgi:hypothetical protein
MPEKDDTRFRPPRNQTSPALLAVGAGALVLAAVAGAWLWLKPAPPSPVAAAVPAQSAAPASPSGTTPPPAGVQNPVGVLGPPDTALPPLAESDVRVAELLSEVLGAGEVSSLLQTESFARRVVATVDSLTQAHAPVRVWPVHPTPQRFLVDGEGAEMVAAPANARRYAAMLAFAESVPMDNAVALYARLYPLFQQAYEELGYPNRYFNDRLVAVLDHLVQAPEPQGPIHLQLTKVQTELPDPRPWLRYEFADPQLQALSSGQKIMVRMGAANEARAKKVLRELRRRVATSEVARKPAS